MERDYEFLKANGPTDAEVEVVSRTRDESRWVVSYFQADAPTSYAVYDKQEKTITNLFVTNPKLLKYKFAHMEDVRIKARDGLELVGYLTRATKEGPSPLVLLVHGGPWAREFYGFDTRSQWFANRGYSTLKVGKHFGQSFCVTVWY